MTVYLIFPTDEKTNRSDVLAYENRDIAIGAATPNATIVETEGDIIWTGRCLVDVFNAVTGLRVSKFESSDVGRKRLLTQLPRYARDATPPTTRDPARVSTEDRGPVDPETGKRPINHEESTVSKAEENAAAVAARKAERAAAKAAKTEAAEAKRLARKQASDLARAAKAERAGDAKTKIKLPAEGVITVVADKNPKREGTKAHDAFALYRSGMTCAEFLAAGGSKADLSWDRTKGFIYVSDPA